MTSSSLRTIAVAAPFALAAALFSSTAIALEPPLRAADPAPVREIRPIPRLEFDITGMGLLDRGAVNLRLARAGLTPLPSLAWRSGGRMAFEVERFYVGVGLFALETGSERSGLSALQAQLDFGYRLFGNPKSWEIIPVFGLGGGATRLTLGTPGGATSFDKAINGPGLVQLKAASFYTHVGVIADLLRLYNPRTQTGISLGLTGGFIASPISTSFRVSNAAGTRGGGALAGSPHAPGTGPYFGAHVTFSF
jgi:hypothetical protein